MPIHGWSPLARLTGPAEWSPCTRRTPSMMTVLLRKAMSESLANTSRLHHFPESPHACVTQRRMGGCTDPTLDLQSFIELCGLKRTLSPGRV